MTATHVSELANIVVLRALLAQVTIVGIVGPQAPVLFGMTPGCPDPVAVCFDVLWE